MVATAALNKCYPEEIMSTERTYEELMAEVGRLRSEGLVPSKPTREQMIDWAYGNTKIESDGMTREIATRAVDETYGHRF